MSTIHQQQEFVLRWHYHDMTLLKNLPALKDANVLTDVTLAVGNQHLKAHRLVLALCSVYFLQLFQEMGNTQQPIVVLNNVEVDDIKAVLAFIYQGQCIVTQKQIPSLLALAKLLKIQGLCDMKVNDVEMEMGKNSTGSMQKIEKNDENQQQTSITDLLNESAVGKFVAPTVAPTSVTSNELKNSTAKSPSNAPALDSCKCFLCGKYLSNPYNLRVHIETHQELFHACQSCPHVSRSRDALRKHVAYRHPELCLHSRKRRKID